MRKFFSLIVATAIFLAGLSLLIVEAWSPVILGKVLIVSGLLLAVGGYWLRVDFVAPALGIRTGE